MHEPMLKAVLELGGTATTSEVVDLMNFKVDNCMYSALDAYERKKYLIKEKIADSGRNTWVMTDLGKEFLSNSIVSTYKEYEKELKKRRAKSKPRTANSSKQKDLLENQNVVTKPKKEPEIPMPSMSEAATAAVEGFAKVIDNEQKGRALLMQMRNLINTYLDD